MMMPRDLIRQQSYQKPEASNFPPMTFGGIPHMSALGFFLNTCFCLLAPLNTAYLPGYKECNFSNCSLKKFQVIVPKSLCASKESYPIRKTKQLAITAAVVSSGLLLKSHQPYNKSKDGWTYKLVIFK